MNFKKLQLERICLFCFIIFCTVFFGCENTKKEDKFSANNKKPNIILMTVESLRSDHVGAYGYAKDTTPSLDSLAREGILFENAFTTTSWTLTSHASIFTGLYPTAHKVTEPLDRLDDSYTTIAEQLQAGGYQTASFISGPYLKKKHNLNQGFSIFDESSSNVTNDVAHEDITNPNMEKLLTTFIEKDRAKSKPFFLFAYLWDPHYDYIPPKPYNEIFLSDDAEPIDLRNYENSETVSANMTAGQHKYLLSQYDGEIRATDDLLGRLWSVLKKNDLWENTVIIITSDHGEEFFDHKGKGHKNNLYNESLHVPLIIKLSQSASSSRDPRLVNLIDLYPTILDVAGIESDQPIQGSSLVLSAPPQTKPSFYELVTTYYLIPKFKEGKTKKILKNWYAVRKENFKLISNPDSKAWELYDLATDPFEQAPLGETFQQKKEELITLLVNYRKDMETLAEQWGKSKPANLNSKEIKRLKSLGYIQ